MEQSEYSLSTNNPVCVYYANGTSFEPALVGTPIIAGDGYTYVPYEYYVSSNSFDCTEETTAGTGHIAVHSRVMRVGTDGSSQEVVVGDWSYDDSWYESPTCPSTICLSSSGAVPNNYNSGFPFGYLITNADQGVLYSWSVCFENSDLSCTPQHYLTTISSDGSASTVQVASVPGQATPLHPVVQRADGSYVGTVSSTVESFMVAFTASGNTLWTVPNDTPETATADGGVIGTSGTTYDQDGNVDGQITNMPTYSWKGAYQGGDVASLADLLPTPVPVPGANAGGSPTGGGTAVAVHSIGLFWCGATFSGTCQSPQLSDGKGIPEKDLGFVYSPKVMLPNVNWQQNFTTNNAWAGIIINQAFVALRAAFTTTPVMLSPQSSRWFYTSPLVSCINGTPDHVVNIVGDQIVLPVEQAQQTQQPGGGVTDSGFTSGSSILGWNSVVYYSIVMFAAQFASPTLDSPVYPPATPSATPSQQSAFQALLAAIGKGIGNSAAHELGHQFKLPDMDCDKGPGYPDCPGPGAGNPASPWFLYEYYAMDAAKYLDVGPPLQWDTKDQNANPQLFKK